MTQKDLTDFIAARQHELTQLEQKRAQLVAEFPNDKEQLAQLDDAWCEITADVTRALKRLFLDFTPPHIQALMDMTREREIGRRLRGNEKRAFKEFMSDALSIGWALPLHPRQSINFISSAKDRIIRKYKPTAPEKFAPVIVANNMLDDLRAILESVSPTLDYSAV